MIDWKPLEHAQAYDIIDRIYAADGGEDVSRSCSLSGEPVMYNLMTQSSDPRPHLSSFESWQLNQEKSAYRKKYLDYWQATASQTGTGRPVDAVIAPVSNWASCPHDTNDYVGYTTQWNLLVSVSSPCSLLPHTHTTYCSPTPPPPSFFTGPPLRRLPRDARGPLSGRQIRAFRALHHPGHPGRRVLGEVRSPTLGWPAGQFADCRKEVAG